MKSFIDSLCSFKDRGTSFDKIVMFSHREKQIDILKFIMLQLFLSEVLMLFSYCQNKTRFIFICSAQDLFTMTSNKFRMNYGIVICTRAFLIVESLKRFQQQGNDSGDGEKIRQGPCRY